MGRRSEHSLEQIKQMAIEAAEKLVAKSGFEGLSTRKIAGKMGYTSGSLYMVFKNLDELVLHVNARTLDRLLEDINKVDGASRSAAEAVEAIAIGYLKFCEKNQYLWQLAFEYKWTKDFKKPAWYEEKILACFRPIAKRLAQMAPQTPEHDILMAARALWCAVQGIYVLHFTGRLLTVGEDSYEVLTDFTVKNFLKGFLTV